MDIKRKILLVVLCLTVGFIGLVAILHFTQGDGGTAAASTLPVTTTAVATTGPTSTKPPVTTAATTTTRGVERRGLVEAVAAGLVEVQFEASGGASGDVVEMLIRRLGDLGDATLEVTVPTGLILSNPVGGEQDLVVLGLEGLLTGSSSYEPADEITLFDDEWRTYLLEAYCAEAHDANPSEGGALGLGEMASPDLVAVLEAVDDAGAAGRLMVVQAVVWAMTDDVSAADLEAVGYGLDEERMDLAREIIEAAGLDPADFRLFD